MITGKLTIEKSDFFHQLTRSCAENVCMIDQAMDEAKIEKL